MNPDMILEVVKFIALLIFGGVAIYIKTKAEIKNICAELTSKADGFIAEAEMEYINVKKAGTDKHNYVVKQLYALVPRWAKFIFTEDFISHLVEKTFAKVESYAKTQLDKVVDKHL